MQIMVPDRTVGLIIGRGGETIRDLQERSGCHINIVGETKSVNGLRPVNLIGTREAAARAKDFIMEIVDSDSRGDGPASGTKKPAGAPRNDGPPRDYTGGGGGGGGGGGAGDKITDAIYVPSDAVGMIIGKGGETIREMQNVTGCKINVAQSSGPGEVQREIALVGTRESIAQAKLAIDEKVDAVVS
jgi:far upstream element-binding protein